MLGKKWANLYDPDSTPKVPDEYSEEDLAAIKKIEEHFERYLPDFRERQILLDWVAHNVQHPSVKIRWSPYIHGPEGDGKSFFFTLVGGCLGDRNVRTVSGSTLESNFTDWAVGYTVICIEEMKHHGHNRYDVMNRLKPMVSNDEIEIHPKGRTSYCTINTANYMILSNYLNGAPVNDDDRRYCFLSSGLTKEEAKRMTKDGYYEELFSAVHQHPRAIRKWFLSRVLDASFHANGRAPETTMKRTVVEASRGDHDAIGEDVLEAGGWGIHCDVVSSHHFTKALQEKGVDIAKTKGTKAFLLNLGFIFIGRHQWNGCKARIWIRRKGQFGPKAEIAFGPEDKTLEQELARNYVLSETCKILDGTIAAECAGLV
jgi:hypothetical protein